MSPVFVAGTLEAHELTPADAPELQAFFERNPEYFVIVDGDPPGPSAGHDEIVEPIPAGMPYGRQWRLGLREPTGALAAMANVTSDLLAAGVWHLGLLIVETARHGNGDARRIHQAFESWAASNGACWLRLGVVQGNARAERFWERLGYVDVRTRAGVAMGRLVHTLRVMVKPLDGDATLAEYLARVARDRLP